MDQASPSPPGPLGQLPAQRAADAARRHAAHAPALYGALSRLYGHTPGYEDWIATLMA